jgi:hypothetical protein
MGKGWGRSWSEVIKQLLRRAILKASLPFKSSANQEYGSPLLFSNAILIMPTVQQREDHVWLTLLIS